MNKFQCISFEYHERLLCIFRIDSSKKLQRQRGPRDCSEQSVVAYEKYSSDLRCISHFIIIMATTIAANNDAPAPQTFTLHIISPSLGSHGPFSFPNLPTATTVQQLKAKIRERVQTKPHNDHQRLIHRGRQLTEVETMADVFGKEMVCIPTHYSSVSKLTCS